MRIRLLTVALIALARIASAQECTNCAPYRVLHAPFRVYGNTYFVGTNGLSAMLITSDRGHVVIDGGLPETAPIIESNIRALGFKVEDVKVILNSHTHFDHAGGIAELQKASGARVVASPASARELAIGAATKDDPQYRIALPYPKVSHVELVKDGETVRVGPLALTAHYTAGHTPGGTTWSWESCEASRCLEIVYADSQTPISDDSFLFTNSREYPAALQDFEHGYAALESMRCDILITPHPGASQFWERVAARDSGRADKLIDSQACKRYARASRAQLEQRLKEERSKSAPR